MNLYNKEVDSSRKHSGGMTKKKIWKNIFTKIKRVNSGEDLTLTSPSPTLRSGQEQGEGLKGKFLIHN